MKIALFILLMLSWSASADPVFHSFEIWGKANTSEKKLVLYMGWANGFFTARPEVGAKDLLPDGSAKIRLVREDTKALEACLSEKVTYNQALAMIDKYYNDHPELWSIPFTWGIYAALTVPGSPCEGK